MEKIKAIFTFEILGRPAEHVKESLSNFIDKLEKIKGVKIENKNVYDAKPVKDEKVENLFTSFAEVEISAENIDSLILITMNMLPAHVEIIEPADFKLNNSIISSLLSDLTVKLHKYDEIAKALVMERDFLRGKLKESVDKIKELENPKKSSSS